MAIYDMEKLTELFLKLPGVGPRQAKRFAYFLAGEEKQFSEELSKLILDVSKNVKQCDFCFRFIQSEQCDICADPNRDRSTLLVIEKDVDMENIEKSGAYNGLYLILGGVIPLTEIKPPQKLRMKNLFDTVQSKKPKEVILATSATAEGENTAQYIMKILEPLAKKFKIKISTLGRGLSTGTELEYSDSTTIENALKNRS